MLDKGQIGDWDGEPEDGGKAGLQQPTLDRLRMQHEALPTGERVKLTPQEASARKRRGQWIALALFAFVILVFVLTMSKVGGGIPERM